MRFQGYILDRIIKPEVCRLPLLISVRTNVNPTLVHIYTYYCGLWTLYAFSLLSQ